MWGFCDFGGLVWMHKLKLYDMGKGIEPHFLYTPDLYCQASSCVNTVYQCMTKKQETAQPEVSITAGNPQLYLLLSFPPLEQSQHSVRNRT